MDFVLTGVGDIQEADVVLWHGRMVWGQEFCRAQLQSGRTPEATVYTYTGPLSIGDFSAEVERIKREPRQAHDGQNRLRIAPGTM